MRTKPPCYGDGKGCADRHVGCHADCQAYKDWQAVHADETSRARRNKHTSIEVDTVLSAQGKRKKQAYIREYMREYNKRGVKA